MSEPEWSLPMNRTELIARVEALEALLFAAQQAVITEGLARDKAQAALRPLAMAAKSWHDFHHDEAGYSAVQCDEICKALPLALAALSQSETPAKRCICDDHQGINIHCSLHGTDPYGI